VKAAVLLLVEFLVLPVVVGLLVAHLDRESGRLSRKIVRAAARMLPPDRRDEERDEWLDHVITAGERGIRPLTRALSIAFVAAPLLAVGLRIGRSARRVPR
jgi:hypothetical protein